MVDISQQSRPNNVVVSSLVNRIIVSLIANFEDSLVAAGSLNHSRTIGLAFSHHLFAQHVLSLVETSHCYIRMHPQRSSNNDRLKIFLCEHLAPFIIFLRLRPTGVYEQVGRGTTPPGVDVAKGSEVDEFFLTLPQMAGPHIACADQGSLDGASPDRSPG